MKKLLSIAAVAALLSTGAMADTITINGKVLAGAQVSFGAAPTGDLVGGTFTFKDAVVGFESLALGIANTDNQDVYVKTNSNNGVKITLVTTPDLSDGTHTVPTTYKLGDTTFVAGSALSLTAGTNDGSAAIANKFTTTATPAADQVSGTYAASIDVTIAQN